MARLEIRLLGPLEVALDGQPVSGLESDKVRALLAYLAVESARPHRREKLAGLLWPDSVDEAARTNLRRALSNLRTAIRDQNTAVPVLDASAQDVQLNRAADVWVDVIAFEQYAVAARPQAVGGGCPPQAAANLQSAVDLYRGPFLEGFSLGDSSAFEEWSLLEQERLHRLFLEALHCLAELLEQQGEPEQALRHAWRQVELEPWRESGHQQVMHLLARTGQRSAALAQFEACRRSLARDLGAEPSVETVDLYRRIRDQVDGRGGPGLPQRAAQPPPGQAEPPAAPARQVVDSPRGREITPSRRWLAAGGAVALLAILVVAAVLIRQPWWHLHAVGQSSPTAAAAALTRTTQSPPAATSSPTLPPTPEPSPTASATATSPPEPTSTSTPLPEPTSTVTPCLALPGALPCALTFASTETGAVQDLGHVYLMDRDGRQRMLLPGSQEGVEESRPLWLPGRKGIIYERVARVGNIKHFSLWRMNPDGSGRRPLLDDSDARAASVSADGTRLAFVSDRAGSYHLFVADLDGTDIVQVTQDKVDHRRPTWSPDGKWLAFDSGGGESSAIYVIGIDGSGLKRLTEATHDSDPVWSPDGRFIAFVSGRDGNAEIYVMNADGSGQTNVSWEPYAEDRDVSWTPDQQLVFASDRDGDWEIYVMNRNGSHVVQLTANEVDDRWPNWR